MRKSLRTAVGLAAFLVMTLGFQNCSPFQAGSTLSSSASPSSADGIPGLTGVKVSAIMAAGHMGRTLMSCDGGRSWIHDRSDDDAARCWQTGDPNYVECDHNAHANHSVEYGDGYFYATFGWGFNGSFRRSKDGVNWTTLRTDGWGPGSVMVGHDLMLGWAGGQLSHDDGLTWTNLNSSAALGHDFFYHRLGSLIVSMSNDGTIGISSDVGQTWPLIQHVDPQLTSFVSSGNGRLVLVGNTTPDSNGNNSLISASSSDGGQTWSSTQTVANGQWLGWQALVFNGTQFVGWNGGQRLTSSDGITWTAAPIIHGFMSGQTTYHAATSTYVTVSSSWGAFYTGQRAYYSTDGLNWIELDAAHFKGGHPVNSIVIGDVDSSACKGP